MKAPELDHKLHYDVRRISTREQNVFQRTTPPPLPPSQALSLTLSSRTEPPFEVSLDTLDHLALESAFNSPIANSSYFNPNRRRRLRRLRSLHLSQSTDERNASASHENDEQIYLLEDQNRPRQMSDPFRNRNNGQTRNESNMLNDSSRDHRSHRLLSLDEGSNELDELMISLLDFQRIRRDILWNESRSRETNRQNSPQQESDPQQGSDPSSDEEFSFESEFEMARLPPQRRMRSYLIPILPKTGPSSSRSSSHTRQSNGDINFNHPLTSCQFTCTCHYSLPPQKEFWDPEKCNCLKRLLNESNYHATLCKCLLIR